MIGKYGDSDRKGGKTHSVEDTVNVESRVDSERGVEDHVPDVASTVGLGALPRQREKTLGRVGHVLLHIVGVVALRCDGVKLGHE